MKHIIILGSTGSIGTNALSIIKQNLDVFSVYALVAEKKFDVMFEQCKIFKPRYACMTNYFAFKCLKQKLSERSISTEVIFGTKNVCDLITSHEIDLIIAAMVGISGLDWIMTALRFGKFVLLANKEILISCGKLLIDEAHKNRAKLLPIDSEYLAILQSLPENFHKKFGKNTHFLEEHGISKIILTGSGGPFYKKKLSLNKITPKQACSHPNWFMGKKISVDSATMMNKGLEYIGIILLFNALPEQINILLHPQSIVHGMVQYIDGSTLAQLSVPDMKIFISYALFYPKRKMFFEVKPLDLLYYNSITFEKLDYNLYPCLKLAIETSSIGQSAFTALNAANEIAVDSFLSMKIRFTDIFFVIREVLESLYLNNPKSIEEVLFIDNWAREKAKRNVKKLQ